MPEIRELVFPAEIGEKIWRAHGLTEWDVKEVVFDPESELRWDVDEEHGGRAIVRGRRGDRLVFVAVRPVDVARGLWACVTAFAPTREDYGEA